MRRFTRTSLTRIPAGALGLVALLSLVVYSQQPEPSPAKQSPDDIIRINTELVQTEVMVLDRQGRFVPGLRSDQFEVSLNGAAQPVSFFEQVTSGSAAEASQLAAARAPIAKSTDRKKVEVNRPADNGRVIFFFVDDLHLGVSSLSRARKLLQGFVENQMNPTDQIAVVSTSGQIGFLQQLTDNPVVLNTAISRLHYKQDPEANTGKTQISDYMASQVLDYGNRELYAYLLESIKVEQQMGPGNRHGDHGLAASYSAAPYLRNRLRQITAQGRMTTDDTLSTLESLMTSSADLPGRKLVFFLSDGFVVNERKSGALESLHRLTKAATRSGVVVYTMDLRGVFSNLGSGMDASTNNYADTSGRRAGIVIGEVTATQEPLKLIADETGGRAILNTNAFSDGILDAIRETADYYLLAWRPSSPFSETQQPSVIVTIRNRPDLRVRLRNNLPGAPSGAAKEMTKTAETKEKAADELLKTLGTLYPDKRLPVSVSVGYFKTGDANLTLKVSMQLDRKSFSSEAKLQKTEVDVMGVAVDDRGQFASFKQVVSVPLEPAAGKDPNIIWHQQLSVKPGLFQVRVAVRERTTGRTGSAMQWIQLPETGNAKFGLSSLFLGERTVESVSESSRGPQQVRVDVDHRFKRSSALRFQTYVYNAALSGSGPDVSIQSQVFRNRREVMRFDNPKVPLTGDASRLPYWSEIALESLTPGQYVLQIKATDQIGNQTAIQRVSFWVE